MSAEDDRGDKFEHYKRMPSLRQYVLASHRERVLEVWTRDGMNAWKSVLARDGERAVLASIDVHIDVGTLYDAAAEPAA